MEYVYFDEGAIMEEANKKIGKMKDLNTQCEDYQYHVITIIKQEIAENCISKMRTHGVLEMFTWLLIERNKWYRMTGCNYSKIVFKFIESFLELQLEIINFNREKVYAVQHFELVEQKHKEIKSFHDWDEFNFMEDKE